jgi:predicted ATPase
MLKKLTIRNFKAIQDMTIEFTPLTVLIGENSCGKSTILQAVDFLRSAASRDIPEYLREKGWTLDELKSQCTDGNEKPLEFVSTWDIHVWEEGRHETKTIEWSFSADKKDEIWHIKEKIICCSSNDLNNDPLLSYHNDDRISKPEFLDQLNIQSSALKYVANTAMSNDKIDMLYFFLSAVTTFELLSPEKMRSGNKMPFSHSIGVGGEALAYRIYKMNDSKKQEMNKIISDLIGFYIEVQTFENGGKIELSIICKTDDDRIEINSKHISDGLLRIIAFIVISMGEEFSFEYDKNGLLERAIPRKGMILLDEIENGINPYLTEKVILRLRNLVEKSIEQVIITTHSPVILNEFKPEEIVFLWKDAKGSAHSKKFFDTEEMREALGFLNPGEIWENYGKDTILTKLGVKTEER